MHGAPDVIVVGAGLVGLASALSLAETGRRVAVFDASGIASHQSGRNSGVIHSGLYYAPGSAKAELCVRGRDALYRFIAEEEIPYRRCGKLVVAVDEKELSRLDVLETRGRANGLVGIRRLNANELPAVEPAVEGLGGLWVPDTGIVKFRDVAEALARRLVERGAELRTDVRVLGGRPEGASCVVTTTAGRRPAGFVVVCAGLHADRVARSFGLDPQLIIVPFRGEYHELVAARRSMVRGLIYPVPDPSLPFLGVHFTRTVDDRVEVGPNAVWALAREGYRPGSFVPRDAWDAMGHRAFWRMVRRHWSAGLAEAARARSRWLFTRALRRFVPTLRPHDIVPTRSGIRAQAVDRDGKLVDDFVFVEGPRSLHVLNAPSPAATACLAIGEHIARQVNTSV